MNCFLYCIWTISYRYTINNLLYFLLLIFCRQFHYFIIHLVYGCCRYDFLNSFTSFLSREKIVSLIFSSNRASFTQENIRVLRSNLLPLYSSIVVINSEELQKAVVHYYRYYIPILFQL